MGRHDKYFLLDDAARCLSEELYDHFRVQPCWSGVTNACNATLQRFACYENFKRCDQDGFYVGTCRKACDNVVYEYVNHLEQSLTDDGRFLGDNVDSILFKSSPDTVTFSSISTTNGLGSSDASSITFNFALFLFAFLFFCLI